MALMIGSSGGGAGGGLLIPRCYATQHSYSKQWSGSGTPAASDLAKVCEVTGFGRLLWVYTPVAGSHTILRVEHDGHSLVVLKGNHDMITSNRARHRVSTGTANPVFPVGRSGYVSYSNHTFFTPSGDDAVLDASDASGSSHDASGNPYNCFCFPDGLYFTQGFAVYAAQDNGATQQDLLVNYELFERV